MPPVGRADSPDEARAIIAKGIQAVGGEAVLSRVKAVHYKTKGVITGSAAAGYTTDTYTQLPDQYKVYVEMENGGNKITMNLVLNGQKGWVRTDQEKAEDDAATVAELQDSGYVDYVSGLLPLIKTKGFEVTSLGEVKVRKQPAAGALVKSKNHPDVKLYFDKTTGLLMKTEFQRKEAPSGKPVLMETYLSDYQGFHAAAADEQIIKAAKIAVETPALLEFLRKQTVSDDKRTRIKKLIRDLASGSFDVREKAVEELIKQGEPAVPFSSQAMSDPDAEVAGRAKECLEKIGKPVDPAVAQAVLRLVAERKPAGSAGVLLDYLLCAPNEEVRQHAAAALEAVARPDGKPDKALVQALEDKDLARREAAAAALGRETKGAKENTGRRILLPGLKYAMKGTDYRNGKEERTWEVTEVHFYDRFSDSMFVKP